MLIISPFGLLYTDSEAYKYQKLISHISGGWKSEIGEPAWLSKDSFVCVYVCVCVCVCFELLPTSTTLINISVLRGTSLL